MLLQSMSLFRMLSSPTLVTRVPGSTTDGYLEKVPLLLPPVSWYIYSWMTDVPVLTQ